MNSPLPNFSATPLELRLKRRERAVYRVGDMPTDLVDAIAKAEPPDEATGFDHEYADAAALKI